jgi:hypothetical protein
VANKVIDFITVVIILYILIQNDNKRLKKINIIKKLFLPYKHTIYADDDDIEMSHVSKAESLLLATRLATVAQ